MPDAVVARRVGVGGIDLEQRPAAAPAPTSRSRRAASRPMKSPLSKATNRSRPAHPGRHVLPELGRPDPIALLEPQAVQRAVADEAQAVGRAGLAQLLAEGAVPFGRHDDLVAELAGQRDPAAPAAADAADAHVADAQERDGRGPETSASARAARIERDAGPETSEAHQVVGEVAQRDAGRRAAGSRNQRMCQSWR